MQWPPTEENQRKRKYRRPDTSKFAKKMGIHFRSLGREVYDPTPCRYITFERDMMHFLLAPDWIKRRMILNHEKNPEEPNGLTVGGRTSITGSFQFQDRSVLQFRSLVRSGGCFHTWKTTRESLWALKVHRVTQIGIGMHSEMASKILRTTCSYLHKRLNQS